MTPPHRRAAALLDTASAILMAGVASDSTAPTTGTDLKYPVYSLERPWHSGTQVGLP